MKNARQLKILEIIAKQEIRTQEELILALQNEDYRATQATVSRDIKELHLQKIPAPSGGVRYGVSTPTPVMTDHELLEKYKAVLRQVLISAVPARNLAVVKTLSGTANAAAAALEILSLTEIIGTLAGDDTLLCVFSSDQLAFTFCRMLNTDFIRETND